MKTLKILAFLIPLLLTSCIENGYETPLSSIQTQLVEVLKTKTPEATNAPFPTFTSIPSTQQPTPTQTWEFVTVTPIPDDVLDMISDLYANNANCQFSCWWGIVPGKTAWLDALEMMSPFITDWYEYTNYSDRDEITYYAVGFYISSKASGEQIPMGLLISVRNSDGVVESISHYMDANHSDLFHIPDILEKYGKPISIILRGDGGEGGYAVNVFLYYPSNGFLSVHTFNISKVERSNGSVEICSSPQNYSGIILWDPSDDVNMEKLSVIWPGDFYGDFYEIVDVSNLRIDDFYNAFTDADTTRQCVSINTDILYSIEK